MYVIEHAILNPGKNKSRNILLGVIIFTIITATVVAMTIYNTSAAIINEYKARFGSEVTIAPKTQQIGGNRQNQNNTVTPEMSLVFAQSEYLQSADLSNSLACGSDYLTAIDQNGKKNSTVSGGRDRIGGDLTNAAMRLRGGYFADFDEKKRQLAAGDMPEEYGECIVSTDFAELNGLSAGDTISLTAGLFDADNNTRTVEITLTVAGTYYDVTDEYSGMAVHTAYQNRRNEILTNFDTVLNVQSEGLSGVVVNAVYYLKSPDLLSAFDNEIRGKGLPADYNVRTDEAGYKRMIDPVTGLQGISLTFLVIVLTLGAIIMILLSVIAIRERKYEIGVLRAMGMKKQKVALGLWTEIIAVTSICFVIGMGAGTVLNVRQKKKPLTPCSARLALTRKPRIVKSCGCLAESSGVSG